MASYIESNLGRDEHIIYRGQVSWPSQLPLLILGILTLPLIIGIYFIALAIINVYSTELALTNKRVLAKFGFIRRSTIEINTSRIESISVNQGMIGRLFNYGSIVIQGTGGSQAPIPYINSPLQFRSHVNAHIDELAQKSN